MKFLIVLEEMALTAIGIFFLTHHHLDISPWIWALLFFAPDISMLGYLFNNSTGAISYNIFHHRGLAIGVAAFGYFINHEMLVAIGILLFTHASFDRILGYGLKYFSGFKNTHLGNL